MYPTRGGTASLHSINPNHIFSGGKTIPQKKGGVTKEGKENHEENPLVDVVYFQHLVRRLGC